MHHFAGASLTKIMNLLLLFGDIKCSIDILAIGEQLMQIEPLFGVIQWLQQSKCLLKLRHRGD